MIIYFYWFVCALTNEAVVLWAVSQGFSGLLCVRERNGSKNHKELRKTIFFSSSFFFLVHLGCLSGNVKPVDRDAAVAQRFFTFNEERERERERERVGNN